MLIYEELTHKIRGAATEVHRAPLLTYLRLSGKRAGLLIKFNMVLLKDGIRRMVL